MGRFSSRKKCAYNKLYKEPLHLTVTIPLAKVSTTSFTLLRNYFKCSPLPSGWTEVVSKEEEIAFCRLKQLDKPTISHRLCIHPDLSYNVSMYDHSNVNLPHSFSIHNPQDIVKLMHYIETLRMCPGNGLTKYINVAKQKGGKPHNVSG